MKTALDLKNRLLFIVITHYTTHYSKVRTTHIPMRQTQVLFLQGVPAVVLVIMTSIMVCHAIDIDNRNGLSRTRKPAFFGTRCHHHRHHHHHDDVMVTMINLRGGTTLNLDLNNRADDSTEYPSSEDDEYSYENNDDSEEDDIDGAQADEATAMHQKRREMSQRNNKAPHPYHQQQQRPKAPYILPPKKNTKNKKKKNKNALVQLAKSSLTLSKKAAVTTVQTSGKAAYYLIRPKTVQEHELYGLWRLDQQVGLRHQSTANIQFTRHGQIVIKQGTILVYKGPYTFVSPPWPMACRVEFQARAFQQQQQPPRLLFYKGYLERKVADSSVLKMVGTIYEIERPKSLFGRKKNFPVKYHKIGSFVGRRRVVLPQQQDHDIDDEDEDDEEEQDISDKEEQGLEDDQEEGDDYNDEYDIDNADIDVEDDEDDDDEL
jgi:hypothetical protein